MPPPCPFCQPDPARLVSHGPLTRTIRDAFPVTPGHTLVVPNRHVSGLFELGEDELRAIWDEVADVRRSLEHEFGVSAFNVGLNDGAAAGQTVPHAHVHVIPRRVGDVDDPRGGVRWVVPKTAAYWRNP